ncbi:MAG: nucleoside triphosphate pyrophosphohydrolase [Patescibacteria group bacterium]|nr:nucleoside triphosphate pyrophosphohydrolase [Patescibacteria group bacterium]
MREKVYHRKLISDKTPEIIRATGDECETRILGKKEFEKELKKKLIEEAQEVVEAPRKNLTNELADVLELIKSIGQFYGIKFSNIERRQKEKKKRRGGFTKKLYLIWSNRKKGYGD